MPARWIERRFERLIWKFRLISIVPVVLSLLGSVGCFVIGTIEVFNAFLVIMCLPFSTKSVAAKNNRPDHKTANASEQAHHHWHNADEPEFPDQPLKPSFNPSRGMDHSDQSNRKSRLRHKASLEGSLG